VTVQVVVAPDIRLAGVHASAETPGLGVTVTVAVALPLSVAVSATVWDVATAPAVTVNAVDVAAAGTVTDAGTGKTVVLSDDTATALPPTAAG
jgi:hypothetical protein